MVFESHCCSRTRYDVLLTANASPRTYWIQALPQYRDGSPSGYGFLTYSNSNVSALPPTPTPASNGTAPWTQQQIAEVRSCPASIGIQHLAVSWHPLFVFHQTSCTTSLGVGVQARSLKTLRMLVNFGVCSLCTDVVSVLLWRNRRSVWLLICQVVTATGLVNVTNTTLAALGISSNSNMTSLAVPSEQAPSTDNPEKQDTNTDPAHGLCSLSVICMPPAYNASS